MLISAKLVETLLSTVTIHLDSQQKWHSYAQNGLSTFLISLHKSMLREWPMAHGIEVLSIASDFLPDNLTVHPGTVGQRHVPACLMS